MGRVGVSADDSLVQAWLAQLRNGGPAQKRAAYGSLSAWALRRLRPQLQGRNRGWFQAQPHSMDDILQETLCKVVRHSVDPAQPLPERAAAFCFQVMFNVFTDMRRKLGRDALGYVEQQPERDDEDRSAERWLERVEGPADEQVRRLELLEELQSGIREVGVENFEVLMKHDHGLWVAAEGRAMPLLGEWIAADGDRRLERWSIQDVVDWRRRTGAMGGEVKNAAKSAQSWLSGVRNKLKELLGYDERSAQ